MNRITHHDFELFETELLSVDFISINIKRHDYQRVTRLVSYLQNLGFNSYEKQLESSHSKQTINENNHLGNKFEVYFILKIPYQKEIIQLQFPGVSGKQFYKLIKQKTIQWEEFPNPRFSRLDVVHQRISKPNDPISPKDFINSCHQQFQDLHSSKNLSSEKNKKGLVLRIGNRRSPKYYRMYTNKNNNLLRFEAEMKGDLIKDFQDLLITSSFERHEFESRIAYQFFKYSFELFHFLNQPCHIDWLANRIRPYQYRKYISGYASESVIPSHYLNQMDYKLLKEKQHLIIFLRLVSYLKKLNYTTKSLTSDFRQYIFPLRDFLKYNNLTPNHYQMKKLKDFFDMIKKNFVIDSFSDTYYRMLVTVPEMKVYKSQQNILMVDIWIADELFYCLHPFLFSDVFKQKCNEHQFQVLFEIIQNYSSNHIIKEFNITQFLDNYPSVLSNQHKRRIREYFVQYIKLLYQDERIHNKLLDLSSNCVLQITDLNSSHSQFAVYENINVKFI